MVLTMNNITHNLLIVYFANKATHIKDVEGNRGNDIS